MEKYEKVEAISSNQMWQISNSQEFVGTLTNDDGSVISFNRRLLLFQFFQSLHVHLLPFWCMFRFWNMGMFFLVITKRAFLDYRVFYYMQSPSL